MYSIISNLKHFMAAGVRAMQDGFGFLGMSMMVVVFFRHEDATA